MKLLFATQNPHKCKEIQHLLGDAFSILYLQDVNWNDEIPEDKGTLEENASQKTNVIYTQLHINTFADDTGLEVTALNGAPGVYSARYAGSKKNSDENISKLLSELEGKSDRSARFKTVISLILNGKEYLFTGVTEGTITHKRQGEQGFGYDPVFLPEGYSKTFAEMNLDEKNQISHRAKAFHKLKMFLEDQKNPLT